MATLDELETKYNKPAQVVIVEALNKAGTDIGAGRILETSHTSIQKWVKRFGIQKQYVLPETKIAQESEK